MNYVSCIALVNPDANHADDVWKIRKLTDGFFEWCKGQQLWDDVLATAFGIGYVSWIDHRSKTRL
jgi:hypothetical protein